MNRLLLNEGGQPVYLDDLDLLQTEPEQAMKSLLEALGAGQSGDVLLLKKPNVDLADGDEYSVEGGIFWLKEYGIIKVEDSGSLSGSITDIPENVYLRITVKDTDARTFGDGQERDCVRTVEASWDYEATGACYTYNLREDEVKTLADGLAESLQDAVRRQYKPVDVVWASGFNGQVETRVTTEGIRWRFKVHGSGYATTEDDYLVIGSLKKADARGVSGPFLAGKDWLLKTRSVATPETQSLSPINEQEHYLVIQDGKLYLRHTGNTGDDPMFNLDFTTFIDIY